MSAGAPAPRDPAPVTARCPSCNSRDVVTTSKIVDASSYWRCRSCGEVWNVARHRDGDRLSRSFSRR